MLQATFRQLQTFLAVVETGGFSAAAARLDISQAAVSAQIAALERRLECLLFERRNGQRPRLSERGQNVLSQAYGLLEQAEEVANAAAGPSALVTVRIASDEYTLERLLRPNLLRFQLQHPDIQLEFLIIGVGGPALQVLHDGCADLVYFTTFHLDSAAEVEVVAMVPVGLFANPLDPEIAAWIADPSRDLPMIMPIAGSRAERAISDLLKRAGVSRFRAKVHAQFGDTWIDFAVAGGGACCVFLEAVTDQLASGKLIQLSVPLPAVHRCVASRGSPASSKPVQAVNDFLLEMLRANDRLRELLN